MERKRERERDTERERYSYLFFYVCVYVRVCELWSVCVSKYRALRSVCTRDEKRYLRSEEKPREFVTRKRKGRLFVSIYHTLSRVKNRGKHEKKHT